MSASTSVNVRQRASRRQRPEAWGLADRPDFCHFHFQSPREFCVISLTATKLRPTYTKLSAVLNLETTNVGETVRSPTTPLQRMVGCRFSRPGGNLRKGPINVKEQIYRNVYFFVNLPLSIMVTFYQKKCAISTLCRKIIQDEIQM